MKNPNVSVIVPNYNHSLYLNQRLDSILNQTYQDFEVIILDDCSSDDSKDIIEAYRENKKVSHIIYNKRNSGSPFKQWLKGVQLAIGKYIWIAESDDYAEKDFLMRLIEIITLDPQVKLVYSNSNEVDENNNFLRKASDWAQQLSMIRWNSSFIADGNTEIKNYLSVLNTIPNTSAVIFKKEVSIFIEKVIEYKISGDWLFWILVLQNNSFGYVNETLNNFRFHCNTTRMIDLNTKLKAKENYQIYNYANASKLTPSLNHHIGLQHIFNYWSQNSFKIFLLNFNYGIFKLAYKADRNILKRIARLFKKEIISLIKWP